MTASAEQVYQRPMTHTLEDFNKILDQKIYCLNEQGEEYSTNFYSAIISTKTVAGNLLNRVNGWIEHCKNEEADKTTIGEDFKNIQTQYSALSSILLTAKTTANDFEQMLSSLSNSTGVLETGRIRKKEHVDEVIKEIRNEIQAAQSVYWLGSYYQTHYLPDRMARLEGLVQGLTTDEKKA